MSRTLPLALIATVLATTLAPAARGADGSYSGGSSSSGGSDSGMSGGGNPYAVAGSPERPAFAPAGYRIAFTVERDPYGPVTFTMIGTCEKPPLDTGFTTTTYAGSFAATERWSNASGEWAVVWRDGMLDETATTRQHDDGGVHTDTDHYAVVVAGLERTGRHHRLESPTARHDWVERWAGGAAGSREGYEEKWSTREWLDWSGDIMREAREERLTWNGPLTWTRKEVTVTAGGHAEGQEPWSDGTAHAEYQVTDRACFPGTETVRTEDVNDTLAVVRRIGGIVRESYWRRDSRFSHRDVIDGEQTWRKVTLSASLRYDAERRLVKDRATYAVEGSFEPPFQDIDRTTTYVDGQPAEFTFSRGADMLYLRWKRGRVVAWRDSVIADFVFPIPPNAGEMLELIRRYGEVHAMDPAWSMGGVSPDAYPYFPGVEANFG